MLGCFKRLALAGGGGREDDGLPARERAGVLEVHPQDAVDLVVREARVRIVEGAELLRNEADDVGLEVLLHVLGRLHRRVEVLHEEREHDAEAISSLVSGLKRMVSSSLLRNSGLK